MKHSPYEIFLFLFFLPMVLSVEKVNTMVAKNIKLFKLVGLVGIISYWVKQDPGIKLMMVLIGTAGSMTCLYSTWLYSKKEMEISVVSNILVLMILMSINFANYSMLPVWTHGFANAFLIFLTIFSVFISPREKMFSIKDKLEKKPSSKKREKTFLPPYIKHGISLGSIIYMVQTLMGIYFFILYYFISFYIIILFIFLFYLFSFYFYFLFLRELQYNCKVG